MAEPFVVSNTGPLISLEKMQGGYDFIRRLYEKIIIPPSVLDEVSQGVHASPEQYLVAYGIGDLIEVVEPRVTVDARGMDRLHPGERDAICLAVQRRGLLLIEETVGRKVALSLGLKISGIAGQVMKAFKRGISGNEEARSKRQEMLRHGRINRAIYEALTASIPD